MATHFSKYLQTAPCKESEQQLKPAVVRKWLAFIEEQLICTGLWHTTSTDVPKYMVKNKTKSPEE